MKLRVARVGEKTALLIEEEDRARLHLEDGDVVDLVETPDGTYRLTTDVAEAQRQLALAEAIMREDVAILRALAK